MTSITDKRYYLKKKLVSRLIISFNFYLQFPKVVLHFCHTLRLIKYEQENIEQFLIQSNIYYIIAKQR